MRSLQRQCQQACRAVKLLGPSSSTFHPTFKPSATGRWAATQPREWRSQVQPRPPHYLAAWKPRVGHSPQALLLSAAPGKSDCGCLQAIEIQRSSALGKSRDSLGLRIKLVSLEGPRRSLKEMLPNKEAREIQTETGGKPIRFPASEEVKGAEHGTQRPAGAAGRPQGASGTGGDEDGRAGTQGRQWTNPGAVRTRSRRILKSTKSRGPVGSSRPKTRRCH